MMQFEDVLIVSSLILDLRKRMNENKKNDNGNNR